MFHLDVDNGTPIYRQIIQQIEYAILSERLKSGDKLPTIRALSVELKINPNTIAKAYGELEIRGILITQVGSGTYISDRRLPSIENDRNQKIHEIITRFLQELKSLGVDSKKLIDLLAGYA
ncbi:MAG: GntR family transcriptional regulator [Treponema sp.]|nr:GntR family transcriptional regulator [Treponema sp.]